MEALFEHTLDTLQGPDFGFHWSLRQVSEEFRNLMTTGQSMQGHNKFRREFYDNVVRLAEDKLRARNVCPIVLRCYHQLMHS
jgi:hypothetical protein